MFADIGLGTDERETILVPAEAVLHIKRWDFVLVAQDEKAGLWRVVRVKTADLHADKGEERLEVTTGLKKGDRVLTKGTILVKPAVLQALAVDRNADDPGTEGMEDSARRPVAGFLHASGDHPGGDWRGGDQSPPARQRAMLLA
jgi:hypothetical protein